MKFMVNIINTAVYYICQVVKRVTSRPLITRKVLKNLYISLTLYLYEMMDDYIRLNFLNHFMMYVSQTIFVVYLKRIQQCMSLHLNKRNKNER